MVMYLHHRIKRPAPRGPASNIMNFHSNIEKTYKIRKKSQLEKVHKKKSRPFVGHTKKSEKSVHKKKVRKSRQKKIEPTLAVV